jgi:hypothetical protein
MKQSLAVARSFLAVAWLVILASPLAADEAGVDDPDEKRRHTERAGGFSFVRPEGWEVREIPGLKFEVVVGPTRDRFATNINVVDEAFKGSAEAYVRASLSTLKRQLKDLRIEKQEPFKTRSGLQGMRLITENQQDERLLRQTFYFFGNGEKVYVLTCSTLAEGGEELDPLFERAMKTFRFEDK